MMTAHARNLGGVPESSGGHRLCPTKHRVSESSSCALGNVGSFSFLFPVSGAYSLFVSAVEDMPVHCAVPRVYSGLYPPTRASTPTTWRRDPFSVLSEHKPPCAPLISKHHLSVKVSK